MRSSFEIIDFFIFELNFFEEYKIFKKNLAMKMGKSIFQNLAISTLFGYSAWGFYFAPVEPKPPAPLTVSVSSSASSNSALR